MENNILPLEAVVTQEFTDLVMKYKLTNINFKYFKKRYMFLNWFLVIITFLLWFLLIITFIKLSLFFLAALNSVGITGQVLIFLASLGSLSGAGYLTFKYWKAIKLQKLIIQELPLAKFYQTELDAITTKKYQVDTVKKEFDLFPHVGVPAKSEIRQDYVINFQTTNVNYSFGTLTRKEVIDMGKSKDIIYTRYPYLIIDVNEPWMLIATIKAMRTFFKIFKSKDNTDLESTEFEKIFAVNANDQILIRKLLTPKVMVNLIELANNNKKIPLMQFDGGYITIAFNNYNVNSFNDITGMLLGFSFVGTYQKAITNVVNVIRNDLEWLLKSLQWIEAYDFKN
ncbi:MULTISPECIES: DUF3137 domain-containing protein [Spiroplasma]|uniref:DUF3137 domain-containing protein n=1 Tax=Spiroplasma TaxID=2132 RepID=UPI0018DE8E65|nr:MULTISPECIES: DUF3137 domain-containing protein [Spiroplasma]MBH8622490.1 hypothetical protein [Spiroplasma sp. hyd1]UNF61379.1 DUF3137 domain-containing protein [Spiroplasma poulsonii]